MRSAGGYAANVEAVTTVAPADIDYAGRPGVRGQGHPGHPDHRYRWSPAPTPIAPRGDREWTAADTLKNVVLAVDAAHRRAPARRHRRARRPRRGPQAHRGQHRRPPADRRRARHRGRHRRGPARRLRPWSRATSARPSGWTPQRWAPSPPAGSRYLVDPRVVPGTTLDHRRQRARQARLRPGRRPRLRLGRHHRGRRGARRRRGPGRLRPAGDRPRHRDGPHLPARPQVRGGAGTEGAGPERQAGHGHHGLLRRRRHPRGRRPGRVQPRRPRPGLAAQRRPGRRAPDGHRQGRGAVRRGRADRRRSSRPAASRSSSTTAPRSPPA